MKDEMFDGVLGLHPAMQRRGHYVGHTAEKNTPFDKLRVSGEEYALRQAQGERRKMRGRIYAEKY
jgi:hypothetical protein